MDTDMDTDTDTDMDTDMNADLQSKNDLQINLLTTITNNLIQCKAKQWVVKHFIQMKADDLSSDPRYRACMKPCILWMQHFLPK